MGLEMDHVKLWKIIFILYPNKNKHSERDTCTCTQSSLSYMYMYIHTMHMYIHTMYMYMTVYRIWDEIISWRTFKRSHFQICKQNRTLRNASQKKLILSRYGVIVYKRAFFNMLKYLYNYTHWLFSWFKSRLDSFNLTISVLHQSNNQHSIPRTNMATLYRSRPCSLFLTL